MSLKHRINVLFTQIADNCVNKFEECKELFKCRNKLDAVFRDDYEDENEPEYRNWWTQQYILDQFCSVSQSGLLNSFFSLEVLIMLVISITRIDDQVSAMRILDAIYNVWYALLVASVAVTAARSYPGEPVTWSMTVGFLLDIVSYLHYLPLPQQDHIKVVCYFIRVHRPLRFIWTKEKNTMNSSLLVTTLKYIYYTYLLRIICAYFWIIINNLTYFVLPRKFRALLMRQSSQNEELAVQSRMLQPVDLFQLTSTDPQSTEESRQLFYAIYIVNKIFIPIGPPSIPQSDIDRVVFLMVMITGTLMVTGAAVAALSSVISVHMRPEEKFRSRYRIIMRDLTTSGIPTSLRNKVETFYKMYWHKHRAVSDSQLLSSFPPVLPNSVYTDVYFEATQKSGLLRDLSYMFLSELARHMETILYIPGDCIIKRNSLKDSIIYITYGDIEMLTAEDDASPMLRFTRGTILTPWGGAAGGRAHVQVRAGTFCAARVLSARGLWRAAVRHGRESGQARLMLDELRDHMNKVKRHYGMRKSVPTQYKSSILEFKKSLMALKEARDEDGELLLARPDYLLEIAGCYLMRNRADATLTDDSDPICLRSTFPCILQPTSSLLTAWNWLVACLILVVCFIHPFNIIYKKSVSLEFRFFDVMVMAMYVLDIFVYLSTGTHVEEGVPITFMETASKQIRSPWFLVDVLATAPIFAFVGKGEFAGINRVLRFPKVIRMIQSLEEECFYHTNAVRFFMCSLFLIFACYFLAALQECFVCYGYGHCLVTNFTHEPFWTKAPQDDKTVTDNLFFSLYWAISVLTFTCHMELGGELAQDFTVNVYTMLLLEICIVLSISIEAVYSSTIMVTTAFRESFDSCIVDARNFLTRNKMPLQLRQRFIEHLQLCWNTGKAYAMSTKQSSVFYDLPPHVYQDIMARQRSKYILCIPFMKLLHNEDLKNVSSKARIFHCAPNEILMNTGDISTEMYIIKQGFCEVLNPDTREVVGSLVAKSHFGVLECLFRIPAFYTVRTTTHVLVFSISRKYLLEALELPQIKDAMQFTKEQEEYQRLEIRREPFVSYRPPACVPNRMTFKLPRKHEKDSTFLQPFMKFGFFSILRNVFPRFTFRPDSELLTRYEVCRSFCAVVGSFVFPSYTYLVLQFPALYFVSLVLDLSAYVDIVFRLFVGFFDEKGILIYHPANTAAHYLRGAFLLDLLGCVPLEQLEVSMKYSYGSLYQVTAVKQILMMNRLLQLYRLPGTLDMMSSFIERRDIILVLKVLPIFLTTVNVLTALLVFSSVKIYHSVDESQWAFVPCKDRGGSWIHLYNNAYRFNVTESPWNLHLGCYFWIVYEATTTGYNTMAPTNLHIMGVLFWSMVLGSLTSIYMSVRIISLRAYVNNVMAAYQEHMRDLQQFMKREKLDKQLQKEIVDHYEFNWVKTDGVEARNVLNLCDQITLRSDAILHLYGSAFAKCPILADCDVSLLRVLGRAVRSTHFLEGTTIFQQDDVIHHLYFVYSGQLQLRTCDWNEGICTRVARLGIGSMVGNLDDTPTTRVSSWLVAATDVQLLCMRSAAFHGIVRDCFPVVHELMAVHRHKDEVFINAHTASNRRPTSKRYAIEVSKRLSIASGIVQIFLILTSLLCVYTDLYNAGFQNNCVPVLASLYALDACFLTKILLFITLPQLVTLPVEYNKKAKIMYFKSSEFKLDVASCLPIELFSFLSGDTGDFWLVLSLLRLNRILRVSTVYKYLKRYQKRATENLPFSTLTLVMWFTVYIHCFTCLWYFIGLSVERMEPRQSWSYNDTGDSLCHSQYICSVFFVLTSFAHNGVADIMPKKQIEVVFVSALLIIAQLLYVVYVGEFSNIVHYASFRAFSYYSKFLELQDFLRNNRVSPVLVALVNKYAVLLWRETRGEQLPEFLVNAPLCLKLKVMSHAYKDFGEQHPVFKDCEPALLRNIIGYLRQYYYDENMYVVKQSEITNSVYHVHTGEVQEISENYDEDGDEGLNLRVYTAGEFFGVAQGLKRDKRFDHSYRTTVKSQILTLLLDDWEYLLKHFPNSKKIIDNYQWTSHDDDNNEDKTRKADGSSSRHGLDTSRTLGNPSGSETSVGNLWGLSDGPPGGPSHGPPGGPPDGSPGGLPNVPPGKLPDTQPSEKEDELLEIKRSSYPESAPTDGFDGTTKTKREFKSVKLRDEVKSSLFLKDPSVEFLGEKRKSALRISDKTKADTSVKFDIQELILPVSSSTQLFERIRNAAKAVDDMLARRNIGDNDDASSSAEEIKESKVAPVFAPHQSVEEYLAHKFKMRESYVYNPKREHDDESDTDVRMSPGNRTRRKYTGAVYDGSGREHFKHTQLAETSFHDHSPQSQSIPVLNLERPFGENTPSKLSLASLVVASDFDLQREKSTTVKRLNSPAQSRENSIVEPVDYQAPMTSKQAIKQSDKTELYSSEDIDHVEGTGISKDAEKKLTDYGSDVTLRAIMPAATEYHSLPAPSDISEQQSSTLQKTISRPSVKILLPETDNDTDEAARTAPSNTFLAISPPLLAIEPSPEPTTPLKPAEETLPETQTLSKDGDNDKASRTPPSNSFVAVSPPLLAIEPSPESATSLKPAEQILPGTQTPSKDVDNDKATRTPPSNNFQYISPPLLAIEPSPEPTTPLRPAEETLPETQTPSKELVSTEHDPSITTMRLLEDDKAMKSIVAPLEGQAKDAALSEPEMLVASVVPSISKATHLDKSSKENLADQISLKSKSKERITDTLKLKSNKEKSDEKKSDQDKDTDDNDKERKEKKD